MILPDEPINMTNILPFKPRRPVTDTVAPGTIAPNKRYWLQDIQLATHHAAFLENDMEAVTLLMEVQLDFMRRGTSLDKVPETVRRECAKYLILPSEKGEKAKKIDEILRAVYAGRG